MSVGTFVPGANCQVCNGGGTGICLSFCVELFYPEIIFMFSEQMNMICDGQMSIFKPMKFVMMCSIIT